ncbi:MAG: hypothetical protein ACE5IM_08920, partial [Nitrospinota bacterium]
ILGRDVRIRMLRVVQLEETEAGLLTTTPEESPRQGIEQQRIEDRRRMLAWLREAVVREHRLENFMDRLVENFRQLSSARGGI